MLKLNMYDLEGGERSVFDQELNREKRSFLLYKLYFCSLLLLTVSAHFTQPV